MAHLPKGTKVRAAKALLAAKSVEELDAIARGNPRKRRSVWTKEWLAARDQVSVYKDIEEEDHEKFFNSFRMTKAQFEELLSSIEERIAKEPTVMRQPISAQTQLQVRQSILVR